MNETSDIDALIEGFKELAGETEKLLQDIKSTEVPPADDPDAVIKGGAENLSRVFEAAGLPSKEPAEIEQQIRLRQRSLSSR